jgi:hypothetical protein
MKRIETIKLVQNNRGLTEGIINTFGLKYHHTATRRRYSRSADLHKCESYDGKFGSGIIVIRGRYRNSNNFEVIEYYVK